MTQTIQTVTPTPIEKAAAMMAVFEKTVPQLQPITVPNHADMFTDYRISTGGEGMQIGCKYVDKVDEPVDGLDGVSGFIVTYNPRPYDVEEITMFFAVFPPEAPTPGPVPTQAVYQYHSMGVWLCSDYLAEKGIWGPWLRSDEIE